MGDIIAESFERTVDEEGFEDVDDIKYDMNDMEESVILSHIVEGVASSLDA